MTSKPTPPCLGCKDRVADPNCHSVCEKYIQFNNENDALRKAKMQRAEINSILNAIERRRIDMARKHKFNRFKGEKK